MTAHDVHVSSHTPSEGDNAGRTIRPLDGPAILQLARRLVVFTPNGNQIASLMDKARKAIPMLTTAEVVQRVATPGQLSVAVALACQKIWSLHNQDIDFYSWSINETAARFVEGMGFRQMPKIAGSTAPQFHVFRRSRPVNVVASAASEVPPAPKVSVRVARTLDDFMRTVAIRGAVYLGEQECPYEEEFDGNDFSATHLIGHVDDEPAGCMRVRYFADFAKVERLVVRREFRSSGLAREIVRSGVELCGSKGFGRVCVSAQKRLIKFWSKCGFALPDNPRELVFSDFDYVEMIHDSQRLESAISAHTDPYVIIRPEGDWQHPGILERSIARGVRRPLKDIAA